MNRGQSDAEIDKLAWLYIQNKRLLGAVPKAKLPVIFRVEREEAESDQEALIREMKEELSIDLTPATIEFVGIFKAQDTESQMGF